MTARVWLIVDYLKMHRTIQVSPYHRHLYNFCIREPIVSTYHQIILAEIKGVGVRRNCRYFKGRHIWPIVAPKGGPMYEGDSEFNDLKKEIRKPTWTEWEKVTFISEATWRFKDQRTAIKWSHTEV